MARTSLKALEIPEGVTLEYNQGVNIIFVFLCILAPLSYSIGAIIIKKSEPENLLAFTTHALFIDGIISTAPNKSLKIPGKIKK